jgi:hypothetical protein
MPIVNRHREAHPVDFYWPAYKLVVETDGRGITTVPTPSRRTVGATSTSSSRTGMSSA